MGRIIAIDYGFKRVGLAVTDPLQIICSPLDTVHPKDLFEYLKTYFSKEVVDAIVVGYPTKLDNTATHTTSSVVGLVRQLKKLFPDKEVHTEDERFTTVMAHRVMLEGGASRKQRADKENIDKISASIILQSFLSYKKP